MPCGLERERLQQHTKQRSYGRNIVHRGTAKFVNKHVVTIVIKTTKNIQYSLDTDDVSAVIIKT